MVDLGHVTFTLVDWIINEIQYFYRAELLRNGALQLMLTFNTVTVGLKKMIAAFVTKVLMKKLV